MARVKLAQLGTTFEFDPANFDSAALTIDGVNHLYQLGYWFRKGEPRLLGGGGPEKRLSTVPMAQKLLDPRVLKVTYTDPEFAVEIVYVLSGGSGYLILSESIQVIGLVQGDFWLQFFRYEDYDMSDTAPNDEWVGGVQRDVNTRVGAWTYVVNPPPYADGYVDFFPKQLNLLDDGGPFDVVELFPVPPTLPPRGDFTKVWQWDLPLIGLNSTRLIHVTTRIGL